MIPDSQVSWEMDPDLIPDIPRNDFPYADPENNRGYTTNPGVPGDVILSIDFGEGAGNRLRYVFEVTVFEDI